MWLFYKKKGSFGLDMALGKTDAPRFGGATTLAPLFLQRWDPLRNHRLKSTLESYGAAFDWGSGG
jgi:hypothetical protein